MSNLFLFDYSDQIERRNVYSF